MRFIHTADWQIGKPFRSFGEKESVLRQARLDGIETIGRLAMRENALHVLVAGDLYDMENPAQRTLLEPMERIRGFPRVTFHVIPGNHDPHRTHGLWDRLQRIGMPPNVILHLSPVPADLGPSAKLLPAPLQRKSEHSDLTRWMDSASTPDGTIRIGLAHGAVAGFDTDGEASNPIAPDRAVRAGLAYLALGDWHRTQSINPLTWYAGTHEADRFRSQEVGQVLLVDIAGPSAPPLVTPIETGVYCWRLMDERLSGASDVTLMEAKLRALPRASAAVVRLSLSGALPLAARADLDERLEQVAAALFWLEADTEGLAALPTPEEFDHIDFQGVLREAAISLQSVSDNPAASDTERRRASAALIELFLMTRAQAGETRP